MRQFANGPAIWLFPVNGERAAAAAPGRAVASSGPGGDTGPVVGSARARGRPASVRRRRAFPDASKDKPDARYPTPVTGLLEHGLGLTELVARLILRSARLGGQPEIEKRISFPAWIAESLGKFQRLLEMICGPPVLAEFAAQYADHEIGVGHIAAAIDLTENLPATTEQCERVRWLPLLPAYLGEKQGGLGLTVGVGELSAQLKGPLEAGGSLGQPALAPVGTRKPGQAVGFPSDVVQLAEDDVALREERNGLR